MPTLLKYFFFFFLLPSLTFAQPGNDDCANATLIPIPANGFGISIVNSSETDMTNATLQSGENFAPGILTAGLSKKSVWYKFITVTTRSIEVSLKQPSVAIQDGNVGFTVYKTTDCLPDENKISNNLTPIAKFGASKHPCVEPGEYYIQVSSNNNASGKVFITLDLANPSPAPYDFPSNAYEFPAWNGNKMLAQDFSVECQTIDNENEVCLSLGSFKNYNKSLWFTFKTPGYIDLFNVYLTGLNSGMSNLKVSYRLYEGDAKITPLSNLVQKGGCDSLMLSSYYIDYREYLCDQLKINTDYTIQLIFPVDCKESFRIAVGYIGERPANGPLPLTLTNENEMGKLSPGVNTFKYYESSDFFACNTRHSIHNCPKTLPATGFETSDKKYNLSTFYSFTLDSTATLRASPSTRIGGNCLIQLYKKKLTNNCGDLSALDIINPSATPGNREYACLPPGDYVVQVSGSSDSSNRTYFYYDNLSTTSSALNVRSHLGEKIDLRLEFRGETAENRFSLNSAGKFEKINANNAGIMQPLQHAKVYELTRDTLGCANTLLTEDSICRNNKSIYREFKVADSVVLYLKNTNTYNAKIFRGDAGALAVSQNVFGFPQKLKNLEPVSNCIKRWSNNDRQSSCITPGTYTIVQYDDRLNHVAKMTVEPRVVKPKYTNPNFPEDLGDLIAKFGTGVEIKTDLDTIGCYENGLTIDGVIPCGQNTSNINKKIYKQHYRQFYLSKPSLLNINNYNYGTPSYSCTYALFKGKVSEGVNNLKKIEGKWTCFTQANSSGCDFFEPGWYTVVCYSTGPTFEKPLEKYNNGNEQNSGVGLWSAFNIRIDNLDCVPPKFNRPHKASVDTLTKQPYLIEYKAQPGHTPAKPNWGTTYELDKEYFNCQADTPFFPNNCATPEYSKIAYYVFKTTQESYIKISAPHNAYGSLYPFDVRTLDSVKLKDTSTQAIQSCLNYADRMEICRLQPGIYTLILYFSQKSFTNCGSATPSIYIDAVGVSRFDNANNAYDFGEIAPDSTWKKGKAGDVHPTQPSLSPSNDFIYCTTGSAENDPKNYTSCPMIYNPNIYPDRINAAQNKHPKQYDYDYSFRNVWYSFVQKYPGTVSVKVDMYSGDKPQPKQFAIYSSDEDGTLSFNQLKAAGKIDSAAQLGLKYITSNNYNSYCWSGSDEIVIKNISCDFKPIRYYVLVDRYANAYDNINRQLDVEILFDSINLRTVKFDHYSFTHDMGLVNSGKKKGETDNFTCASRDLPDPIQSYSCEKTLWYKFKTDISGSVNYRALIGNNNQYGDYYIQLFKEIKPGDSTSNGLMFLPGSSYYNNGEYWSQSCISPGTYYLLLTGCNATDEDVTPEIELAPKAGDYCNNPMIATLNGAGSTSVPVTVDCHTIGTDYGEFNERVTCPPNGLTDNFKTSWYRLDIGGSAPLDLTINIDEKTNAASSDIKHRMMTGTCGAMQEQSCVLDDLTRNTYECMVPGNSYYIQVFTPQFINGQKITGDIDLNISAVNHIGACAPANNCIAVAEFFPKFDCLKDRNMTITNLSTYGTDIEYQWSFGYNNQKSKEVSPNHFYPALTTDKTYDIKLVVTNKACGKKDSVTKTINIPARPAVNLGKDTLICTKGSTLLLNATSHPGSTYQWSNGLTDSIITATYSDDWRVEVSYQNCKAFDTINIWINPIEKREVQNFVLCNVSEVNLNAFRGYGEKHKWSNGENGSSITVNKAGSYWCDIFLNGCIIRDSFLLVNPNEDLPNKNVQLCQNELPYSYNATISGAIAYKWNDGNTGALRNFSKSGLYWAEIDFGTCTIRDTLTLSIDSFQLRTITATICGATDYTLPSGKKINTPGSWQDTLRNQRGCDSVVTELTLSLYSLDRTTDTKTICLGNSYVLPSGKSINTAGNYSDTLRNIAGCDSVILDFILQVDSPLPKNLDTSICANRFLTLSNGRQVNTPGIYLDTLKNLRGCDSIHLTITLKNNPLLTGNINDTICEGNFYNLPGGRLVNVAGTYMDTIANAIGCDSVITTSLFVRPPLSVQLNATKVICEKDSVLIRATRSGGNGGPYTYNWLGSTVNADTLKVAPATTTTYFVQIADGCTVKSGEDSILISVIPLPDATINASALSGCVPFSNQYQNNQNGVTYQWTISNGTNNVIASTQSVKSTYLKPGTYQVKLSLVTPEGCKNSDSLEIIAHPTPFIKINAPSFKCAGDTVMFTGIPNDPTGITWQLDAGDGIINNVNNPATHYYPNSGNYTVQLIGVNTLGCADTIPHFLRIRSLPNAGLNGDSVRICSGSFKNLNAKNGTQYLWSPAIGLSNINIPNPVAQPLTDTKYKVQITDGYGCQNTDSIYVYVSQPFSLQVVKDTFVCVGKPITIKASGAQRYQWEGKDVQQLTTPEVTFSPKQSQMVAVTGMGTDECFKQRETIQVNVIPLPQVNVGSDTSIATGSSFSLKPNYSSDAEQYLWTPSTYLDCNLCPNPVTTPLDNVTYRIQVKNKYNCENSDIKKINLFCNTEDIFIPNAFTPNGDGVNDVFYPRGHTIRVVKYFKVYNRWGQLVFERNNFKADDPSSGWDGKHNGMTLPPDVFVYMTRFVCGNGEIFETKGNVMIVR